MDKEHSLLQLARGRGGAAAFSALVKIYQGPLRGFLLRLCKDHHLADDIAQEAFIAAYRKLGSFGGESSFKTWLFKIAYNEFLQNQRRAERHIKIAVAYSDSISHQERYESISTAQLDLENAMRSLPADEAAAITLCHSLGFSHVEAAAILEQPLGTIKTRINRGKSRLRELLVTPLADIQNRSNQRETLP